MTGAWAEAGIRVREKLVGELRFLKNAGRVDKRKHGTSVSLFAPLRNESGQQRAEEKDPMQKSFPVLQISPSEPA